MQKGFTLVELSVVIVIIGLIVAGVVGGQTLINQSKLRSIASDFDKFTVALNTFVLEYDALPGDMPNASSYWGASCDVTPANCDGSGNGIIAWEGNVVGNESTRAWQHLNLSNVLPGSYNGSSAPSGGVPGINVPKASFGHCGYWFWSASSKLHYIILGAERITTPGALQAGCMTGADAENIDKKLDDGIINRGRLIGSNGSDPATSCVYGQKIVKSCVLQFIRIK